MHQCHAEGCKVDVPPKMLMCLKRWRMVPRKLQEQVWATYRSGQEIDKRPSAAYLRVHKEAIAAVREKEQRNGIQEQRFVS